MPSKLDCHTYVILPVPPEAFAEEVKVAGVAPTQIVCEAEMVPAFSAGFTVTVTVAVEAHDEGEFVPVTI